jgi:class 3 adenylate cyclase
MAAKLCTGGFSAGREGGVYALSGGVSKRRDPRMPKPPYTPKPLDTSSVKLDESLANLSDLLAENAHDMWAAASMKKGWKYGAKWSDQAKQHPQLRAYRDLPAAKRKNYRDGAVETLKSLAAMGYRIEAGENAAVLRTPEFEEKSRATLQAFKNSRLTLAALRRLWEERVPVIWSQNVDIYRRAVDAALKLGEGFVAFDIAAEGLQVFKGDLRLIQLQALALARTGAARRANSILEQLRRSGHQDEETLGLLARTYKDFWQLAVDPEEKRKNLKTSFQLYFEGYKRNRGYYSGINAASMGLIYGEKKQARQIAQDVKDLCLKSLAELAPDSGERYWLEATLAEAELILGNLSRAETYYRKGGTDTGMSSVVISRTRAQARLLLEHLGEDPHRLDACFKLPRIAVFSGHMFDTPARKQPRFPFALQEAVRAELRARLAELNVQVGYSSLACGGDMLFTELLIERDGEVNIVLPFRKDDFIRASVDILPGGNAVKRFENVIKDAASVTTLSELGDASDGAAYDFCNQALSGLALLKSRFLGMDVVPLVIWDERPGGGRGGTQTFVDYWQDKQQAHVEVIPLQKHLATYKVQPAREPAAPAATGSGGATTSTPGVGQEIKAMIFADIVGFTRLHETQIPSFVTHFLGKVAELMDQLPHPPIHKNTWGDAVCAVFDQVSDAGIFALNMRDLVRNTDWSQFGLPRDLNIRIALHAGPVFPCYDPVLKKLTFNGSHVNRTARIEPIAEEGQVYASEAFAALATADGVKEFMCDYVGTKQLAKKYGAIPVFLVRRTL